MADDIDIGIGVRTDPAAAAAVDALRARLSGLREMLGQLAVAQQQLAGGASLEGLIAQGQEAAAGINQTIGAFTKLGAAVDASNAKAVAAFREEGLALAFYLEELGATEAEVNKVAAAISRLEQRAGGARFGQLPAPTPTAVTPPVAAATPRVLPNVPAIPPVPENTISSFDRIAPKLRTAANAASLLAIAAATGTGSLQGMATAAGAVTIGIGTLLTGPVGGLITALGAIVTLATTAFGLWKEAHKQLDATMRAVDEGEQARLERIAGADAAQAASITRQANREKQSVQEGKGTAKQKADAIAAIEAAADQKRASLEQKRIDDQKKTVQQSIDAALEAQDKLLLNEEQRQQESLKREFAIRRDALLKQQQLAENDPNAEHAQSRVDAIKTQLDALTTEENNARLKIAKDAADERTALERETNAQILDLIGQHSEAASVRIEQQFDELLKNLKQKGVANAEGIARSFLNAQHAKAAIDDITRTVGRSFDTAQNALARVGALAKAHQISSDDARQQTIAALNDMRLAVVRQIADLDRLNSRFPGNPETLASIDAARTKLVELSLDIQRTSDRFAELKDTGREASTDAIAGFLEGLTQLGRQDRSEIKALAADLRDTRAELNDLLATPANERTTAANNRITDLRNQIEATTTSLDQAKSSITSWRDLFVGALQSIADALVRVSSQMLATALIERALGFLLGAGAGASAIADIEARGIPGVQVIPTHARGAIIRGPGTSTSDSILARLSDGEGVLNARAVQIVGEGFVNFLNDLGNGGHVTSPMRMPSTIPRFNAGGFVESAAAERFGAEPSGGRFEFAFHLDEGVTLKHLKSPAGRQVIVTTVKTNPRQLGLD